MASAQGQATMSTAVNACQAFAGSTKAQNNAALNAILRIMIVKCLLILSIARCLTRSFDLAKASLFQRPVK